MIAGRPRQPCIELYAVTEPDRIGVTMTCWWLTPLDGPTAPVAGTTIDTLVDVLLQLPTATIAVADPETVMAAIAYELLTRGIPWYDGLPEQDPDATVAQQCWTWHVGAGGRIMGLTIRTGLIGAVRLVPQPDGTQGTWHHRMTGTLVISPHTVAWHRHVAGRCDHTQSHAAGDPWRDDLLRRAYRGGTTGTLETGHIDGPLTRWDITSAYASIAATQPLPIGIGQPLHAGDPIPRPGAEWIRQIDCGLVLPPGRAGRILHTALDALVGVGATARWADTGTISGVITRTDWDILTQWCQSRDVQWGAGLVWQLTKCDTLAEYIQELWEGRARADRFGDHQQAAGLKRELAALIGLAGRPARRRRWEPHYDPATGEWAIHSHPITPPETSTTPVGLAATITARQRARLLRAILRDPGVIYWDTDGYITRTPARAPGEGTGPRVLGGWRQQPVAEYAYIAGVRGYSLETADGPEHHYAGVPGDAVEGVSMVDLITQGATYEVSTLRCVPGGVAQEASMVRFDPVTWYLPPDA